MCSTNDICTRFPADLVNFVTYLEGLHSALRSLYRSLNEISLNTEEAHTKEQLDQLIKATREQIYNKENKVKFYCYFNNYCPGFIANLETRFPQLRFRDIRLACYCFVDLEKHEIAKLLLITDVQLEELTDRLKLRMGIPGRTNLKEYLNRNL